MNTLLILLALAVPPVRAGTPEAVRASAGVDPKIHDGSKADSKGYLKWSFSDDNGRLHRVHGKLLDWKNGKAIIEADLVGGRQVYRVSPIRMSPSNRAWLKEEVQRRTK